MPTEAVIPGQRLCHLQDYLPGPGTYVRQDLLYASVVGVKQILSTEGAKVRFVRLNLPTMTVSREKEQSAIPDVGSIVTGKVVRVNPRFATVAIMVVGTTPCREDFQGIIRYVFKTSAQPKKTKSKSTTRSALVTSSALRLSRSVTPGLIIYQQRRMN
ncbi:hypothetical protein BC937DRAFT_87204 [Endogone sp. FLAS-F59071]|nr:hypothetical protein BC937DRAFT_87204 [Endogone sp. FLAS-F59071]|eukprot:RUS19615.1 hypothetical protein BC937DRAFT_87204 [Endogone sp. FLAS-F59071]